MTAPTARSTLLALLGWPVSHSLSPAMHNAAFRATGLDACYLACAVRPDALGAAMAGLYALGFAGANVTIPHKEAVLALAVEADADARAIGAANVLVRVEGGFRAHNTDAPGFLRALTGAGFDVRGSRALILGAGGAARAVVHALLAAGAASVAVANRTPQRARRLVDEFRAPDKAEVIALEWDADSLAGRLARATLVVNATALGLSVPAGGGGAGEATGENGSAAGPASAAASLIWWETIFTAAPRHALAVDLVYDPPETAFLQAARRAGLATLGGLPMLVHQAALAWTHWFGSPGPDDIMLQAALAALAAEAEPRGASRGAGA